MRDCRLECVQAVIERQKRMPAEANDDRLFLDRQHRRSRFLWSRPSVHDRAARLPLAHRLLIDAVTSGERSQALFTMLYRSTDRLSRRGAPVKNLAHTASFDSCPKNAPSKCETKHLGDKALYTSVLLVIGNEDRRQLPLIWAHIVREMIRYALRLLDQDRQRNITRLRPLSWCYAFSMSDYIAGFLAEVCFRCS